MCTFYKSFFHSFENSQLNVLFSICHFTCLLFTSSSPRNSSFIPPYPIPHTTGPPIDLDGIQSGKVDPQKIIQQSKKGKPLMIFVGVKEPPNEQYTERVSRLWMQSLLNAHIPVER